MLIIQNIKLVLVCIAISTALGNTISEGLGIYWSLGYFAGFLLEHVYHQDREDLSTPLSIATTPYLCSLVIVNYMDKLFQLDK